MVALRKPKPFTVDELEAQLGTLRADVDKTSVSLEALKGRRRELLLSADDAQVVVHDDAHRAAERQIERLKARADALEEVLTERRIEEAEAAKAAERAEVEATVARSRQALANYEDHAKAIVEIIRAVAESDAAIDQFQRAHPDDDPIAGAEQMRSRPAEAEKVLSRKTVQRWVFASNEQIVPEERLDNLRKEDARSGHVYTGAGYAQPVVLRDFEDLTIIPASGAMRTDKLASEIQLPAFHAGDCAIWQPLSSPYASQVLQAIERRAPSRAVARQPEVVLRPISREVHS
jgi:hypothetical protein